MLCAISGEAPQVPVASRKSGNVFEKRLIESYIQENGKDPVTGEELSVDDLIELRTERIVKPRPPTLTSIPSLLSAFQNEWDALALETYTLKQHLSQLRQELSTALYNNDAAVRVIARLTKERDDARDALSKVSMQDRKATAATNGGPMQVDNPSLPDDVLVKIESTQERLSKTRRKRATPDEWAAPSDIQSFEAAEPAKGVASESQCLALDHSGRFALLGEASGSLFSFSLESGQVQQILEGGGNTINDLIVWHYEGRSRPVLATASGEVVVLEEDGSSVATFAAHAGAATGVSLHPSGEILASVGLDKSYVLYDLTQQRVASHVITDSNLECCEFHPDGHLLAAGTSVQEVKIFDVKSGSAVATFDTAAHSPGPVARLSFSENGIWLAVAVRQASTVGVWDLRKMSEIKTLQFAGHIDSIKWDYTGRYLAAGGASGVAVQYYDKGSKTWEELLSKGMTAFAVEWGPQAKSLVVLSTGGGVGILG